MQIHTSGQVLYTVQVLNDSLRAKHRLNVPRLLYFMVWPLDCDFGFAFTGADVKKEGDQTGNRFRYPSYVQDIMG